MFENHDSIETDVLRPEHCPVTDRELGEASPTRWCAAGPSVGWLARPMPGFCPAT